MDYAQFITLLTDFQFSIVLLLALAIDKLLGEPKRFHPLIGFGYLAQKIEKTLNKNAHLDQKNKLNTATQLTTAINQKILGCLAWLIVVLPIVLLVYLLFTILAKHSHPLVLIISEAIGLYLAIGLTSLKQHAMQVYNPLNKNDLATARYFTGYLVSRNTSELTSDEMARATVESMLENGHDAVIASLVWYLIGGIPFVIMHRLANTLDAMWGYKNERFIYFGWFAARVDDCLGFISAKVCTLLYALQQPFKLALSNAYQQGNQYKSHNGGWVIAAGATVLNIQLGGKAIYHGVEQVSPVLGMPANNKKSDAANHQYKVNQTHIPKSLTLVTNASIILCLLVMAVEAILLLL